MMQYSFDEHGQMVPCPDREQCGAYLLPDSPEGYPMGCTGQRKWCGIDFSKSKRSSGYERRLDKNI